MEFLIGVTFMAATRGKTIAALVFVVLIAGPVVYVYATQGLSDENVAVGDGYALVLTVHPSADPNLEYYTIRVKKGNSGDIRWIYIEGNGLAQNITNYSYIDENSLTPSVTGEGGMFGFRSERAERLWREGDKVHLLLNIRGKVVDLGTAVVRTSSLQADDYALLAAYVLVLTVVAVLVFPRLSAFVDIVTSRAPSPGVSSACFHCCRL